jgi:hypothetical protein
MSATTTATGWWSAWVSRGAGVVTGAGAVSVVAPRVNDTRVRKPVSGSVSRRGSGRRGVRGVRPHRRYALDYLDGTTPRAAHSTVQVHPARDIPIGTLRAIERDLESAPGTGWFR